jgi:hypothetical protein
MAAMPIVPPQILESVAFVYVRVGATYAPAGTGTFVAQQADPGGLFQVWFLTARHVVARHPQVFIRLHPKDPVAGALVPIDPTAWCYPDDSAIDLAWVNIAPDQARWAYGVTHREHMADRATITKRGIGVGDETFLAGLLPQHVESGKPLPVVRHGHVAMMPGDPVRTELGAALAYLVEIAAHPGQSGAPVWAYLSGTRTPGVIELPHYEGPMASLFMIGVMHGYFQQRVKVVEASAAGPPQLVTETHVGISIVVPLDSFLERLPPRSTLSDLRGPVVGAPGRARAACPRPLARRRAADMGGEGRRRAPRAGPTPRRRLREHGRSAAR